MVSEGLRRLLEPEYAVIAAVADGEALIKATRSLRPDLIIADISMPLRNGIDAIRVIKNELPQIHAICLTMHADRSYLADALEAGATGFVVKHAAADELRLAIKAVLRGGSYVTPLAGGRGAMRGRAAATGGGAQAFFKLTQRQRQVLQLVAEGFKAQQIATLLELSPKTVEFHKYRIMSALGLDSTAAMIQFAIRHGMIAE